MSPREVVATSVAGPCWLVPVPVIYGCITHHLATSGLGPSCSMKAKQKRSMLVCTIFWSMLSHKHKELFILVWVWRIRRAGRGWGLLPCVQISSHSPPSTLLVVDPGLYFGSHHICDFQANLLSPVASQHNAGSRCQLMRWWEDARLSVSTVCRMVNHQTVCHVICKHKARIFISVWLIWTKHLHTWLLHLLDATLFVMVDHKWPGQTSEHYPSIFYKACWANAKIQTEYLNTSPIPCIYST